MSMHIDYAAAVVIFLISFIAIISLVSASAQSTAESAEKAAMELYANSLLKLSEDSDNGIGTKAYFFELTASGNGIASFSFSNISHQVDRNSVAIYQKGSQGQSIPFRVAGDTISFATNGTQDFAVWLDDDSAFYPRNANLPQQQAVASRIWPLEEKIILSYSGMQKFAAKDYAATRGKYDFRIYVADDDGNSIFSYGPTPSKSQIFVAKKQVLFQRQNADVEKGWMVIEVW